MVRLLNDRIKHGVDNHLKPKTEAFLKRGSYPLIREIPGLGWLVETFNLNNQEEKTIIRYEHGELET